jgi:hypothetical protein
VNRTSSCRDPEHLSNIPIMGLFKSLRGSASSHPQDSISQPSSQSQPNDPKNSYEPPPYAPPSYAPPTTSASSPTSNPPPYHDWQSVPDTSELPPPPPFTAAHPNATSIHNAPYSAAAAGHAFCASNPPFTPSLPTPKIYAASLAGRTGLQAAPSFKGKVELKATGGGQYGEIWHVESSKRCPDANLMSILPMYFAKRDAPFLAPTHDQIPSSKTIYYETRVLRMRGEDAAVAVGYAGKPYPGWRLPGWHRGSIGVHGDDGRRFVNDSFGGIEFVGRFKEGETVGIGMRFALEMGKVEVFFTRDGKVEGQWWVDEERDAERDDGGVEGLSGEGDMYLCVGCFGAVEFEVVVERRAWLYKGDGT